MFFPIRTDIPLRRTPWMNWLLILVNVLIFLAQPHDGRRGGWDRAYYLDPNNLSILNYFSYAFLHGGWMHLIGNMLFLYIFGNNVNDKMGSFGYLAFYLAGGIAAGIGHVLTANVPILGASGAVAAVTGAYLVLFPRSHITVFYMIMLIGVIEIPSMYFIAFFFLKDLVLHLSPMPSEVAHMAHISGTLFGFIVCLGLLALKLLPRDLFDVLALMERWNRRRQHRELVAKGYDPFGYIPPSRSEPRPVVVDPRMEQIQDIRAQIHESIAAHKLEEAVGHYLRLKQVDPEQVLSKQAQLDIANQLFAQQQYRPAAEAYESFIKYYPKYEQIEQVQLMLGLIYARYVPAYERARDLLSQAVKRLHSPRELDLAQGELREVETALAQRPPTTPPRPTPGAPGIEPA
ncbi:MAG TPA: rhomboid family intramembrane serine protease [Tepidisphaeraceae bacterium]|jgi:membrane associated rhomboid family serine protease|nr:rhomboid family intramembrane serine protease [Tepidisphaeraceae bacterium]